MAPTDLVPISDATAITPIHLLVLLLSMISLVVSPTSLPPTMRPALGCLRRAMALAVGGLVLHAVLMSQLSRYKRKKSQWTPKELAQFDTLETAEKLKKLPNEWEDESAHPSRFLTTTHGKPRLFPFPLGKAGGNSLQGGGELWWEAGNAAHVGHFNQRETPEARAALKAEMTAKERKRARAAKKAREAYDDARSKWSKRLSNIKMVSFIVVLGLLSRTVAAVALAVLIYYTLAIEINAILAPTKKEKDGESDDDRPVRRKPIKLEPGMAMTYLFEPDNGVVVGQGGAVIKPQAAIPTSAPSHRLMTSTSRSYAS